MASFPKMRLQSARPRPSASAFCRHRPLVIAATLVVAAIAAAALSELASSQGRHAASTEATPSFLTKALGAARPQASLVRTPAPQVTRRDREGRSDGCRLERARPPRLRDGLVLVVAPLRQRRCAPDVGRLGSDRLRRPGPGRREPPRRRPPRGQAHLALAARHEVHTARHPGGRRRLLRRAQARHPVDPGHPHPRPARSGRHPARARVEHGAHQRPLVARAAARRPQAGFAVHDRPGGPADGRRRHGRDDHRRGHGAQRRRSPPPRSHRTSLFLHFAEAFNGVPACPAGWNVGNLSGGTTSGVATATLGEITCWKKAIAADAGATVALTRASGVAAAARRHVLPRRRHEPRVDDAGSGEPAPPGSGRCVQPRHQRRVHDRSPPSPPSPRSPTRRSSASAPPPRRARGRRRQAPT